MIQMKNKRADQHRLLLGQHRLFLRLSRLVLLMLLAVLFTVTVSGKEEENDRNTLAASLDPDAGLIRWVSRIDELGSLHWIDGPESESINTFSEKLDLIGSVEPGTRLVCGVFLVEKGEDRLLEKKTVLVGASGLLEETLPVLQIGRQKMILLVKDSNGTTGICLSVNRWSRELEDQLIHLQVNLYEEWEK